MERIETIIAAHPFWHGMRIEFLPFLAQVARMECFGVDDLIFKERDDASRLFLVHEGKVALEKFIPDAGVTTLRTVGPGEAVAWDWCFAPYLCHTGARSVDATEILVFDAALLRSKSEQSPAFGRDLMNRIAQILWHDLAMAQQRLESVSVMPDKHDIDECLRPVDPAALRSVGS